MTPALLFLAFLSAPVSLVLALFGAPLWAHLIAPIAIAWHAYKHEQTRSPDLDEWRD